MGQYYSKEEIAKPQKTGYELKPKTNKKSNCCGNMIVWYVGFVIMYLYSPW